MKGFRDLTCLGLVTLVLASTSTVARAQPIYDHLECFKMKDPHNFAAGAMLLPLQLPPFFTDQCKIKVRGREFCIPVEKTLVSSTAPAAPVVGQNLTNDYICYVASCTNQQFPPTLNVVDQFGQRTLTKFKRSTRICTPAYKVLPTTTTTTSTTTTTMVAQCNPLSTPYPQCADQCPTGLVCLPDASIQACRCGSTTTTTTPQFTCNSAAPAPQCDGTCPLGDVCVAQGNCAGTVIPCLSNADCTAAQAPCINQGACNCVGSSGLACGSLAGPPQCYGDCAVGQVCVDPGSSPPSCICQ